MKRWDFLSSSIPFFLERPEVAEIVVCDETGEDVEKIKASAFGNDPKLRLVVNETRLGPYFNKRKALSYATSPWVAVLDSDNLFSESWFETISSAIQKTTNKQTLLASATFRSLNMESGQSVRPCEQFENVKVDKQSWNSFFLKKGWNHLLNDGNWVIPREALSAWPTTIPEGYENGARFCDALFALRCMIEAGYTIWYVPDLEYIHTVHPGSTWLTNSAPSTRAINTTNWYL